MARVGRLRLRCSMRRGSCWRKRGWSAGRVTRCGWFVVARRVGRPPEQTYRPRRMAILRLMFMAAAPRGPGELDYEAEEAGDLGGNEGRRAGPPDGRGDGCSALSQEPARLCGRLMRNAASVLPRQYRCPPRPDAAAGDAGGRGRTCDTGRGNRCARCSAAGAGGALGLPHGGDGAGRARPRDGTGAARHHRQLHRARLDRHGARPRRPAGRTGAAVSRAASPLGRQGRAVGDRPRWCNSLAGPEGRYITGQTIHVNGGLFLGR